MKSIVELVSNLSKSEGINSTYLPQIKVFKNLGGTTRSPLLYNQGVIFMITGEKRIYTECDTITYDQDNFIVITVPMPLECQAIPTSDEPIYALTMNIESSTLNQLVNKIGDMATLEKLSKCDQKLGVIVSKNDEEISNSLYRLANCLQDPLQAKVLGEDIIKEIIFKILLRKEAAPLYALAMKNTNLSKIDIALKEVQKNYAKQFDVESLATLVNMSTSSFHSAFKNVTSSSPIQYLKKIRLTKARDYLVQDKLTVNEAAINVGYESVSQFSREFKRYYGYTPGSLNKGI